MTEINNKLLALFENQKWHKRDEINPDYASSSACRERLLQYLMGQGEMWKAFCWYCTSRMNPEVYPLIYTFYPWFTLPVDTIPRWLLLLQEWLQMDETVERFGWKTEVFHDVDGVAECKFLTEWARLAQDEKEG